MLKQLARDKGKTIMATIHQPSSEAFLNFDRLILMADGHIVYQGIATESAAYFNMRSTKSKNLNPCDFFMRELAINYPKTKDDEERLNKYLSKYSKTNLPVIQTQMKAVKFGNLDIAGEDFKPVSMYKQYQLLFYRTLIFNKREPAAVLVKFFQQIFFGLITLLLW